MSGIASSDFGTGGRELGTGEVGGVIEGTGGVCLWIGGTGGTSVSCGNETVNGVIKESASEILFESLRSTGDFIAVILMGEAGALSKGIGDEGAEDTRLITLFWGKTIMPHLLTGRTGAGVNSGGVTGEVGSDGGGGSGRITASTSS